MAKTILLGAHRLLLKCRKKKRPKGEENRSEVEMAEI